MNRTFLGLAVTMLLTGPAAAQSVEWTLDPAHSRVGFTAKHLGFAKVRGDFRTFTAKLTADAKTGKLTALEATAEAKSVDTGNAKRDEHLRSDDFFGASQFPTLKLVVKDIKWRGKSNKFTATVALTIRDVTKDVKFDGELLGVQTVNFGRGAHQRVAYEAHAKINRKDFNLKFAGLAEGIALVHDDVEMHLEAEFSYTPPPKPEPPGPPQPPPR